MKHIAYLTLIILIITSCSPGKRLSRLIDHHPELKTIDSITFRDTISIPQVQKDTSFLFENLRDTVIIQKDRLEIFVKRINDTLYIRGKCKSDTIFIERKIPVEKIKVVKQDKFDKLISKLPWLIIGLIFLIILAIFIIQKFKL